jgi:hypothetical protein
MSKFDGMRAMKAMVDDIYNVSVTENGAIGYKTTNKPLLDLNFNLASYRNKSVNEIVNDFNYAFVQDPVLAMQWLFYARDAREGAGERRFFREAIKSLATYSPIHVIKVLHLIPEYGRYDDLWVLLEGVHTSVTNEVLNLVRKQIKEDIAHLFKGESISLLAKWLPSANASSKQTKHYASIIRKAIGFSEKKYRNMLTSLRKHLNVVETKMSAKEWELIDYETVPSKANLVYNSAFLRNDEERRRNYLASLAKGEAKINASVLFPHEIVHNYADPGSYWRTSFKPEDGTLEALWKALPDTVKGCGTTLVVADGSGSMTSQVDRKSSVCALEVANALAIYFAERASGPYKDNYITFSETPQFVDLSKGKTLRDKLVIASKHNEVANTNIEAVFDLILKTAITHSLPQEDLPENLLIISDMEFDGCAVSGKPTKDRWGYARCNGTVDARLFETIKARYKAAGYKVPRLIFWNVCSRTSTIPVKENDLGVALVSGFSTNLVKMVMSNKTDPYECLLETLNSPRYLPIKEAFCGAIVE